MDHVKVDDEMKKRILQNIENEMKDEQANAGTGNEQHDDSNKIRPFSSRFTSGLRRYGGLAAMFAVLIVAAVAVVQITGDIKNTSSTSTVSYDSAPASGMMESESAAEAPVSAESAESTMADAEYAAEESAVEESEYIAEEPAATETEEYDGAMMEAESAAEAPVNAEPAVTEDASANTEKAEDAWKAGRTDNLAGSAPADSAAYQSANKPAESVESTGNITSTPEAEIKPSTQAEPSAAEDVETAAVPVAENETVPQPSTAKVVFAVLLPVLLLAALITAVVLVIRKIRKRKK